MKLVDCKEEFYFYSGKTSDIVRYLGFAGIAIIWFFKEKNNNIITIPDSLYWPLILLLIGLTLDLLHYIVGTIVWDVFHRMKDNEEGVNEDTEIDTSNINWPTDILFYLKIIPIITAYMLIIIYFLNDS